MKDISNYHQLAEIIKPYLPQDVKPEQVQETSHLINDLNINSAHLVDIVLDVEDHYNIRLEESDMQQMQTVADALRIIQEKTK
ncbi:acyl carrier protein [Robiginitalea sp. IMCC43444]|uniref:acyl carrier protein n=1 Tax=Robiginitalea sp. IMCC43444 TaxID=3459121 RepID=UPI00404379C2